MKFVNHYNGGWEAPSFDSEFLPNSIKNSCPPRKNLCPAPRTRTHQHAQNLSDNILNLVYKMNYRKPYQKFTISKVRNFLKVLAFLKRVCSNEGKIHIFS